MTCEKAIAIERQRVLREIHAKIRQYDVHSCHEKGVRSGLRVAIEIVAGRRVKVD